MLSGGFRRGAFFFGGVFKGVFYFVVSKKSSSFTNAAAP
jgi:hypothetical protein